MYDLRILGISSSPEAQIQRVEEARAHRKRDESRTPHKDAYKQGGQRDRDHEVDEWAFVIAKLLRKSGLLPDGAAPTREHLEDLIDKAVVALNEAQSRPALATEISASLTLPPILDTFRAVNIAPRDAYEPIEDEPEAEGPRP